MEHQSQALFHERNVKTSAKEHTHSREPSAELQDTNINLIRSRLVHEINTHWYLERDITQPQCKNQVNSILAWATPVHVVCKCDESAGTTKYNVVYKHHRVTSNCHCDILLWTWNALHNTGMIQNSNIKINHESICITHYIITESSNNV